MPCSNVVGTTHRRSQNFPDIHIPQFAYGTHNFYAERMPARRHKHAMQMVGGGVGSQLQLFIAITIPSALLLRSTAKRVHLPTPVAEEERKQNPPTQPQAAARYNKIMSYRQTAPRFCKKYCEFVFISSLQQCYCTIAQR